MDSLYDEAVPQNDRPLPPLTGEQQRARPTFYLDLSSVGGGRGVRGDDEAGGVLRLTSPELEKLMAQHGALVATPSATPTTQILFPKTVTEEQEAYARGFIDALERLHQGQGRGQGQFMTPVTSGVERINYEEVYQYLPTTTSVGGGPFLVASSAGGQQWGGAGGGTGAQGCVGALQTWLPLQMGYPSLSLAPQGAQLKEEPQTVPSLAHSSPPITGFDDDERLELKRARNRVAAQKCRGRKLERIAVLSGRVEAIRRRNAELGGVSEGLRGEVEGLRAEILSHVQAGCRVLILAGPTGGISASMSVAASGNFSSTSVAASGNFSSTFVTPSGNFSAKSIAASGNFSATPVVAKGMVVSAAVPRVYSTPSVETKLVMSAEGACLPLSGVSAGVSVAGLSTVSVVSCGAMGSRSGCVSRLSSGAMMSQAGCVSGLDGGAVLGLGDSVMENLVQRIPTDFLPSGAFTGTQLITFPFSSIPLSLASAVTPLPSAAFCFSTATLGDFVKAFDRVDPGCVSSIATTVGDLMDSTKAFDLR